MMSLAQRQGVSARVSRRTAVRVQASASRPTWFPGHPIPAHLDGTLPGDYAFDPFSLGVDPAKLKWYQQAEIFHCRTAMFGVVGILVPDLLRGAGLGGEAAQTKWFDAGAYPYFAPPGALFVSMMYFSFWVEMRRLQDIKNPGSVSSDPIFTSNKLSGTEVGYPGFDPLGYGKLPAAEFTKYKVNELKNGRLAMVAFLGFAAQAWTTGLTPLEALSKHLADPWNTTVFSNDLARL